MNKQAGQPDTSKVAGRNAVLEILKSGQQIDTLFIASDEDGGSLSMLVAKAKAQGAVIKQVNRQKLDFLCGGLNHQGVVCSLCQVEYATVEELLMAAKESGTLPFFVIADEIEDPHNLGAIIRTAECAGANGIIIPERRGVSVTSAVYRASAGAAAHIRIARVVNLAAAIDTLKKNNVWVFAADMDGQSWCQTDLKGSIALVIGSEGKGVGRLIRQKCDGVISLPLFGKVNSLNASVCAGIMLYEIARQRNNIKTID